jgi:imidazoleglycerol-phosphate dehydratase
MTAIRRTTRETDVRLELLLGGEAPQAEITTGDRFLDHMLETLARYAGIGLRVRATGDLPHHLVEDVAITLGEAFREAIPARCARYGTATVPMDDALVQAAVDVGGRAFYGGTLPDGMYDHFMRSLADNGAWTLHLVVQRGEDVHHVIEAAFKALGRALAQAIIDSGSVFSTKGSVRIERGAGAFEQE